MTVNYVVGDATEPKGDGPKLIVHCCNDQGGWGSGFVLAVSKRWKEPEAAYRLWYANPEHPQNPFKLGSIQVIPVDPEEEIAVVNLIGQHKYGKCSDPNDPFVRYDAIAEGLTKVADLAKQWGATVHMPRIGCGLAGGDWWEMGPIIEKAMEDVDCTVYDPPER